jgi:hypothetical protein
MRDSECVLYATPNGHWHIQGPWAVAEGLAQQAQGLAHITASNQWLTQPVLMESTTPKAKAFLYLSPSKTHPKLSKPRQNKNISMKPSQLCCLE